MRVKRFSKHSDFHLCPTQTNKVNKMHIKNLSNKTLTNRLFTALCFLVLSFGLTRPKQLNMAATARVIWLCACVRYWPDWVGVECVTCFYCQL